MTESTPELARSLDELTWRNNLRSLEKEYYSLKEKIYFDFQQYRRQTITGTYITSEKLIEDIRHIEKIRALYLNARDEFLARNTTTK